MCLKTRTFVCRLVSTIDLARTIGKVYPIGTVKEKSGCAFEVHDSRGQGNKGTYNAVLDLEAPSKTAVDLLYQLYCTLKHKKEIDNINSLN